MSKNSRFSEKYFRKNGPGAASAQGMKSKFWHNTPNERFGKVPKFHGASTNGVWYRWEKPQGADFPPSTSNRVKLREGVVILHVKFLISSEYILKVHSRQERIMCVFYSNLSFSRLLWLFHIVIITHLFLWWYLCTEPQPEALLK